MHSSRSTKSVSGVVILHDDEDTFTAPAVPPTGSILFYVDPTDTYPRRVAIGVDRGDSASGDVAISAGAYYVGYDANSGKWRRIGDFNGGLALTINAIGFEEKLLDVLGAFSSVQLVLTTDKELTVTATPISAVT